MYITRSYDKSFDDCYIFSLNKLMGTSLVVPEKREKGTEKSKRDSVLKQE